MSCILDDAGKIVKEVKVASTLMLSSHLADVIAGMVLVGVGTFVAQAYATGFVGQAARTNRGVASGTYLACYFFGGLVGSAVLGHCSIISDGSPALQAWAPT